MSRSEEEDISTSESTTQAGQQLSISDFLLHALTTGRIKQSSKKRRLGRLAATVGVLLHRLDARLSLEGDTLRERVCLVGFFISVPFISIAAVFWAATLIAYGKYYAAIAPLVYICTAAVTSTLLFWRRIRPQIGSTLMLVALQILPLANHLIQGSFHGSAAVLCWSTITPPLAGIQLQSRLSLALFTVTSIACVIAVTIVAETTGTFSSLAVSEAVSGDLGVVFFFVDVIMPSLVLLAAIVYHELRLSNEQRRSETLLFRIMPRRVALALRAGMPRQSLVERYECVTCLFADVVGFAELAEKYSPSDVIAMLDALYERMDSIASELGVLKVATTGDAYFAVTGVPVAADPRVSAARMALFALCLRDLLLNEIQRFGIKLRIGMHSGPVVAGVIGSLSPQFTLIGDTVNVASRMETYSLPGKIHCSEQTYRLLEPDFTVMKRGKMQIKGKGLMQTYWLVGQLVTADNKDSSPLSLAALRRGKKRDVQRANSIAALKV